jgi:hypothetical protein
MYEAKIRNHIAGGDVMRKCSGSLPIETEIYRYGPKPFKLGVVHYFNRLAAADSSNHYEFFSARQDTSIASVKPDPTERMVRPAVETICRT